MNISQNISLGSCPNDFFIELYKFRPSITIAVILTYSSICILIPILYSIIWYEKFGSDKKRTVLNKLVSSVCWCTIVYYTLIQVPELFRIWFGPFPALFCNFQLVIKNALAIQLLLTFDTMSILRYIFIFWLKNPYGFCDDFWTTYLNLWMFSFSLISQTVSVILPGMLKHKLTFQCTICFHLMGICCILSLYKWSLLLFSLFTLALD